MEPIIRFFITELGWRQGQPSIFAEKDPSNEIKEAQMTEASQSVFLSTQSKPSEEFSYASPLGKGFNSGGR